MFLQVFSAVRKRWPISGPFMQQNEKPKKIKIKIKVKTMKNGKYFRNRKLYVKVWIQRRRRQARLLHFVLFRFVFLMKSLPSFFVLTQHGVRKS